MADSKIRVGIIGAGRMGITHHSIINSHPNVEVIAVADSSVVVTSMMKKYLNVDTYSDYRELIKKSKPDALLVCTPPFLNNEILGVAAEAGIHCFVEKPYTLTYKQASEISQLFEQKSLVNQVGYVNRFNDVFQSVKELVEEEVLGNIFSFRTEMFSRTVTKPETEGNWRSTHANGGGAVYEMASHSIDLIQFILGKPDKVFGANLTKVHSKNVEDIVSCSFAYKNGMSGLLYVNWSDESYRKPTNKIEIFGSKGKIFADQHGYKIYLSEAMPKYNLLEGWNTRYITDIFKPVPFYVRGNEFTSQLYHFIDCLQNRNLKNKCSFKDAMDTLEAIDEIFNDHKRNSIQK